MRKFFTLWLSYSMSVVAAHYLLILLIWGHDPAPTTQLLILPAIWGNAGDSLLNLSFEIPKLVDLYLGPLLVLWYLFNRKYLHFTPQFFVTLLLVLISSTVLFQNYFFGFSCFIFTGYTIAKRLRYTEGITELIFFGYALFYVTWAFPPFSIGLAGWVHAVLAMGWGFLGVVLLKIARATKS